MSAKQFPPNLYVRPELGTDYFTAHITQCNDEVEYVRADLIKSHGAQILSTLESCLEHCWSWHRHGIEASIKSLKELMKLAIT